MTEVIKNNTSVKTQLHKRNKHNIAYNFDELCLKVPELQKYLFQNKFNNTSVDFSNPEGVRLLNLALLKQFYQIDYWHFPQGYLCPPVPGRVDYIHYLADLLKETNNNKPVFNGKVKALDIGTGASCIYPILGQREYQWTFVASDIDPVSIEHATKNINKNERLSSEIECRLQQHPDKIFDDVIRKNEKFDITLCNPPFHNSLAEGIKGSKRKWENLKKDSALTNSDNTDSTATTLNFGGQKAELWCDGGEVKFIRSMIKESKLYKKNVLWFTCLVSKKENLKPLKLTLKKANVAQVKIVNMAQGQKVSRFIAWTFLTDAQRNTWCEERF